MQRLACLIGLSLLVSAACPRLNQVHDSCQQQQTPELRGQVSAALDLVAFADELAKLVSGSSLCAVDALVTSLVDEARHTLGTPGLRLELDGVDAVSPASPALQRAQRGDAWLSAHPPK